MSNKWELFFTAAPDSACVGLPSYWSLPDINYLTFRVNGGPITAFGNGASHCPTPAQDFIDEMVNFFQTNTTTFGTPRMTTADTVYVNGTLYYSPAPPAPAGATHRIDYDFSGMPVDFLNLVGSNITGIGNAIGPYLPLPSNIQYVDSTYYGGTFSVYVKYSLPVALASLDPRFLTLTIGQDLYDVANIIGAGVALIIAGWIALRAPFPANLIIAGVIAVVAVLDIGYHITDLTSGATQSGTAKPPALSNQNLTDNTAKLIKGEIAGCSSKTCSDPTLTQNQKATCIANCVSNILTNFKTFQDANYANADHSGLTNAISDVQACLNAYNGSSKSAVDYNTYLSCVNAKTQAAVANDQSGTLKKYDPTASAGETCPSGQTYDTTQKKCVANPACWISNPVPGAGCILSASTGKTIAIIGGLGLGTIILISLFKKR
jgi:hypothetical protein